MRRLSALLALLLALIAAPAWAQVTLTFTASPLVFRRAISAHVHRAGRNARGRRQAVNENYGYTAKSAAGGAHRPGQACGHDREAQVPDHDQQALHRAISEAAYWKITQEVAKWRDDPATPTTRRAQLHPFRGEMAEIAGLKVDYPSR